jgi:hypothetical protein
MSNPAADTIPAKRPKTGGRKKGVANKVTREIRELTQKYTTKAVRMAWKIAQESNEDNTRLAAIRLLLGYGHGMPRQRQELTGADGAGLDITRIERVIVDADHVVIEPDGPQTKLE